MVNLNNFKYDNLKNYNNSELQELSDSIRNEIIDVCSKNGGHLSSSLGVIETIVAMHKAFNFPKDKVIFDVGHQAYAHKILSGRDITSLRMKDGISGFQKMSESEFDPYDAGHSSTSISAAMGLACARDLNNEDYNIISFIGDSAISNGLAFEALNQLDNFNHKVIVILNDNNMSISSANGALHNALEKIRASKKYNFRKKKFILKTSKNGFGKFTFKVTRGFKNLTKRILLRENLFENLGLYFIGTIDGYDFKALEKAFDKAKKSYSSVIINVKTTKGKGYKYSEIDNDGFWHGVEPFDKETGKPLNTTLDGYSSWSKVYARGMELILEKNKNALLVTPATTVGSYLKRIYDKYPDRAFDVGIGEEHAVILANALAVGGKKPYVSIYSTFLQRAYDEILHDNARMNTSVTYLVDRAGLVGSDGETHQGIYDVGMLNSIPNINIAMASKQDEALELLSFSESFNRPLFIRYPKGNIKYTKVDNLPSSTITLGKWKLVKEDSKKVCVITLGDKVNEFLNCDITLVNALWINPIDKEMLDSLKHYRTIIVYDPYSTYNGLSLSIKDYLLSNEYKGNLIIRCIPNEFIPQGTISEQESSLGLSIDDIKEIIKKA